MSVILNERCYLCNRVSSEMIETNPGEYSGKNFIRDAHDPKRAICQECKEWDEELSYDYQAKDGFWKRSSDNDNEDDVLVEIFDTKIHEGFFDFEAEDETTLQD